MHRNFIRDVYAMLQYHLIMYHHVSFQLKESPWPGGRVSNTEWIGPGFDLHSGGYVVSLSKTHYSHFQLCFAYYWFILRK